MHAGSRGGVFGTTRARPQGCARRIKIVPTQAILTLALQIETQPAAMIKHRQGDEGTRVCLGGGVNVQR